MTEFPEENELVCSIYRACQVQVFKIFNLNMKLLSAFIVNHGSFSEQIHFISLNTVCNPQSLH